MSKTSSLELFSILGQGGNSTRGTEPVMIFRSEMKENTEIIIVIRVTEAYLGFLTESELVRPVNSHSVQFSDQLLKNSQKSKT